MKKIKLLLKWRKRYYEMKKLYEIADMELYRAERKLNTARSRYDYLLKHNVALAREIDNLNKLFDVGECGE